MKKCIIIVVSLMAGTLFGASGYKDVADVKNNLHKVFNNVFQVPQENNFFNTNAFTQPIIDTQAIQVELKKVGIYIKDLLDSTVLGIAISQDNKDLINKAWFDLSNALNNLTNTVTSLRAMNKIADTAAILEKSYFNNLKLSQFKELLDNLKKQAYELPKIKASLKGAWNDFQATKDIKEILNFLAMQLLEAYRRVASAGDVILKKAEEAQKK